MRSWTYPKEYLDNLDFKTSTRVDKQYCSHDAWLLTLREVFITFFHFLWAHLCYPPCHLLTNCQVQQSVHPRQVSLSQESRLFHFCSQPSHFLCWFGMLNWKPMKIKNTYMGPKFRNKCHSATMTHVHLCGINTSLCTIWSFFLYDKWFHYHWHTQENKTNIGSKLKILITVLK